ncbi:BTAD domain-containing putative transcriptional regulator [Kribbella sp. NPDC051770]|uniref:AfsR/SARP family transcriptional regulator n=1 Tax=Kribbella sp. NPDC051770 TaxID=3155413 RepID=UPI00342E3125
MEVQLLGGVSVRLDGRSVELGGDRLRSLLAILALTAGESVPTPLLVERIWGEAPPANAAPSLHTLVTRLRRAVGADLVTTGPTGYSLRVEPEQVDVLRFGRLLRTAAQSIERSQERAAIDAALALWTGRPFNGVRSDWLESIELPRLEEQYLAAVERRFDLRSLDRSSQNRGEELSELRRLTAAYPLRESLWARFLRLLARSGRTAEALELYDEMRGRIADELGVDPGAELRAVFDELTGARSRPSRRVAPSQLPSDVLAFTGRKALLAELDDVLAGRDPESTVAVVLHGPGGVGKTSLAVHWSHLVAEQFPDGLLFVDLGGYGPGAPVDPSVALGYLLHALGVPASQIPAEVGGRSALLRSTLAGQRVLLVLDNALNAEQVRPLLPGMGAVVLITSRSRLRGLVAREGARQVAIDQLSAADARSLLTGRIGLPETGNVQLLDQLAERCNHLPLALVIAAEQVARRSGSALAELVGELTEHQLDAFDAGDDPATDLRAVFSWSFRTLDPEAARFFRMLSIYPWRRFGPQAAAALTGHDDRTAGKLLRRLADLHLAVETSANRFQLHDLLRAYAAEELAKATDDVDAAWERLLDWAVQSAVAGRLVLGEPQKLHYVEDPLPGTVTLTFADQPAARAWFDLELRGLMAMVTGGAARGLHAQAARLALLLWNALARLVSPDEALAIQRVAAESARVVGHPMLAALATNQLATSHGAKGDLEQADAEFTKALRMFTEIGNQAGVALIRGNLGFLRQLEGRFDESVEHQRAALEITRANGDDHATAGLLNNLAMTYNESGRYAEARLTAIECIRISEDLVDQRPLCFVLDTLGQAYVGLGEVELATERFAAAVMLNLKLGSPVAAVGSQIRLGQAWQGTDDAAAEQAWIYALELIDDHGQSLLDDVRAEVEDLLART